MPPRQPQPEDFVGKTIIQVDTTAINYWVFHFDDGSRIALETDYFGHGLYGIVMSNPEDDDLISSSDPSDCLPKVQT